MKVIAPTGRARPPAELFSEAVPIGQRLGEDASPYLPQRKPLGHATPPWVKDGSIFFITICASVRQGSPLLQGGIPQGLLESVAFLHQREDWFVRLFLVMPDHVHGLFAVPSDTSLASRIAAWKGYVAKRLDVRWQPRFFDHRLRSDESLDEKAHYIRMNPVRAGLVSDPEKWPHIFDAFAEPEIGRTLDGSAGTPRPT